MTRRVDGETLYSRDSRDTVGMGVIRVRHALRVAPYEAHEIFGRFIEHLAFEVGQVQAKVDSGTFYFALDGSNRLERCTPLATAARALGQFEGYIPFDERVQ